MRIPVLVNLSRIMRPSRRGLRPVLLLQIAALFAVCFATVAQAETEHTRLQHEAQDVTIVRDDWGIAHVHGHTDADAVFGMIYAQCEDDFNRVEMNFLTALGWSAQAEGESAIWDNLRYQLFIDPVALKQDYTKSPTWLK